MMTDWLDRNGNDLGILLIRLIVAAVFLYHGSQKLFGVFGGSGLGGFTTYLESTGFPAPGFFAFLAACAEFLGALSLLTGVWTRIMAVPLVFTMLVASFKVHGAAFGLQNKGMEYALTLAVVVAGVALIGPGRWTLSELFRSTRKGH